MIFVKANNLGGAFLWSIDLDDFTGEQCKQGKFPLMNAIKSELMNTARLDPRKNFVRLMLKSCVARSIADWSFIIRGVLFAVFYVF